MIGESDLPDAYLGNSEKCVDWYFLVLLIKISQFLSFFDGDRMRKASDFHLLLQHFES